MARKAHMPAQGLQSWPVACLHPEEGCQQRLLQVPDAGEWLGSGEDDWVSAHPCRWPSICPLSPVALTSGHITGHRGTASPGCGTSPRRHSKSKMLEQRDHNVCFSHRPLTDAGIYEGLSPTHSSLQGWTVPPPGPNHCTHRVHITASCLLQAVRRQRPSLACSSSRGRAHVSRQQKRENCLFN